MGRRVKLGVRCFVVRWLARAALAKTREYGDGTAHEGTSLCAAAPMNFEITAVVSAAALYTGTDWQYSKSFLN